MDSYNFVLVVLSFFLSVLGSFMALLVTRAALEKRGDKTGLLVLAALCLGGVGIWSMHFIGMLALEMPDMSMNFNWLLTAFSFVVGVVGVFAGLFVMTQGKADTTRLALAGTMVGTAVVAMHYTGMAAMEMQADVAWDWGVVAGSVVIAVVAATVALWLAIHVKKMLHIAISALVMGVAVCGMHYTGMSAASYAANEALPHVEPMVSSSFFFSITILVVDIALVFIALVVTMIESNMQRVSLKSTA